MKRDEMRALPWRMINLRKVEVKKREWKEEIDYNQKENIVQFSSEKSYFICEIWCQEPECLEAEGAHV